MKLFMILFLFIYLFIYLLLFYQTYLNLKHEETHQLTFKGSGKQDIPGPEVSGIFELEG